MDSATLRRPIVALIAAYAMALQGLLLAFSPAEPLALSAPLAALCAHTSGDGSGQGQPGRHDLLCAAMCAALGHGIAGPVPSTVGLAIAAAADVAIEVAAADRVAPRRVPRGPQVPRGPPLA